MKKMLMTLMAFIIFSSLASAALDLKFNGAITMNPAAPSVGESVTFSVNFKPSGAAVDNLKCTYGIDATEIDQRTFAHINAEASRSLSFTWTATAGTHKAWFKLDPQNITGDSNIQNNSIEKTFSVSGSWVSLVNNIANIAGKRPVLTQAGLNLAANPNFTLQVLHDVVHVEAANSHDHQPYNKLFFRIIVRNTGGGPSVQTLLDMKIDMVKESPSLIPPIAPNSMYIITREIRCSGTSHLFTFIVDPSNNNTESDETDNTWSQMVSGCQ